MGDHIEVPYFGKLQFRGLGFRAEDRAVLLEKQQGI